MFKKLIDTAQNFFFYRCLEHYLEDCENVLDVGCGYNSSIGHIKKTFTSEGIDIFKKTLELSKKRKLHDRYTLGDIRKLTSIYKKRSFDAVVSIDVIEHFDKEDAKKIIKAMEGIARKKVILLTPNGFYEQDAFDGNPYQHHKSGWEYDDLHTLGYRVYGLRGLRNLRTDHAGIRFKPYIFWGFISVLSELILYPFPKVSFDLFAVKDVGV